MYGEIPLYGFWGGLWHGLISAFSLIGSAFNSDIAIYATNNRGFWYDLGFVLGCCFTYGGGVTMSRMSRKEKEADKKLLKESERLEKLNREFDEKLNFN
jgi:hypothetical protein